MFKKILHSLVQHTEAYLKKLEEAGYDSPVSHVFIYFKYIHNLPYDSFNFRWHPDASGGTLTWLPANRPPSSTDEAPHPPPAPQMCMQAWENTRPINFVFLELIIISTNLTSLHVCVYVCVFWVSHSEM